MGKRSKNVLCRHCYELFRYERIGVLCSSRVCRQVPDSQGVEGRRYLDPRAYGLWKGRLSPKLDLRAEQECPICKTPGKLTPACPICREPLDATIGEVEDHVIGVIGASESGKSHFLATVLYQFLEAGIGGDLWDVEFASRDDLRTYRREFLKPLFEKHQELRATPASVGPELRLVLENKETRQKALLAFRDLGGELFANPAVLDEVDFLRYAGGVVLITDPLAFSPRSSSNGASWKVNGRPTAVEVLETYRDVLESWDRPTQHAAYPLLPEEKYLAVAVTKADLVLEEDHVFWTPGDDQHLESGFGDRRQPSNELTRDWIQQHLGPELAEVADDFADVSYFFVSSFGYPHPPKTAPTQRPEPKRVHEPIFVLLDHLARAGSKRRKKPQDVEDEL